MDSPDFEPHHGLPVVGNVNLPQQQQQQQPDDAANTATTTPALSSQSPTNFDEDPSNNNNDDDSEPGEQAAFQPFSPPAAAIGSAIDNQQQQQQQQRQQHHGLPTTTTSSGFVRPPRPGEPVNNLLVPPPPQQTIPRKRPLAAVSGAADTESKNNKNNNNGQFGGVVPPPRPGHQQQDGSNNNSSNGNLNSQTTSQEQQSGPRSQAPNNNINNNRNSSNENTFESREHNNDDDNHLEMLQALQQQQQQHNPVAQLLRREADLPAAAAAVAAVPGESSAAGAAGDNSNNNNKPEGGHFRGMKMIPNPPDLEAWRERLFNVDETITLTEEQFQTYFPHVDNVYSHRSTQRYKRKPFISHYWDCRLKGRPPGTPKSDDPNKKKRRRTARQRDLCDVKIKITEYFPGAVAQMTPPELLGAGVGPGSVAGTNIEPLSSSSSENLPPGVNNNNNNNGFFNSPGGVATPTPRGGGGNQPFGVLTPNPTLPEGHPGANGAKYYTIQRVNGNGGNGKADGVGGGHRHTLEESDRVKKNSVQRYLLKQEKDKKKAMAQQKTYHKKATGLAAWTVKKHSKESDLKLYGSCFCPFVQRVWIALEVKGLPYQYIEVDPYKKPESLLEVNPRGLVPALRHGDWGCYESTVLLEYLEDLNSGRPLLPPGDPKLRAHCRVWADHINRHIIPGFYRVLQEQDTQKQISNAQELKDEFKKLVDAAHPHGPFFLGPTITFVDVQIAPWILRLRRVLKPYRGWPDPEPGTRWAAWVHAIENSEHIKATTSGDDLYLDSYERYAENRPGTSQLATAINSGRGLP